MEDFSTLLLGETGTGKGAAAAAIGRSGLIPYDERRGCFAESFTRSFVAINLSQFPQALIESELFGHKKGAFTGAIDHHDGVFARCSAHGAIFLDEIGDVSVPSQIKLLQLLQDRTFSPVGGHETLRFRGRVIAATNRPIDDLRRRGEIRDDFFYRLCSDVITLPPLRQRIEEDPSELERLVAVVVVRLTGDESPELTRHVSDALATTPGPRYRWPGNVRELEQAVRRVMITRRYDGETASPTTGSGPDIAADVEAGALTADELLSAYCARLYEKLGTYGAVAQRTRLDRRTVKKYIQSHEEAEPGRR
jgi:transcriptional regulator with PAS, ATPase and Fis domain